MENLFLYLNKRTTFEQLVQEETNTNIWGFTFQIVNGFWKVKSKISVW